MQRRYKIILGLFVFIFGVVVFLEANQPQPVDWSPSFSHLEKKPLGGYVFYESLKEKFPEQMRKTRQSPFEFLSDSTVSGTYLFFNQQLGFGEAELKRLLQWAEKGNTVFLSAKYFGDKLLDTLGLKKKKAYLVKSPETKPLFNFVNPQLKADSAYHFKENISLMYFSEIDTSRHVVLGVADLCENCNTMEDPKVNYIKIPIGEGTFLLHLAPEAFGNYFMLLENNAEYAEKAMAYIDFEKPVYWDERYKSGRPIIASPLSIFLSNRYLKWAYYLMVIGVLLFVCVAAKRKQKSIPIVEPLTNKSREFTDTVAGMYLEQKNHKAIAEKKIALFLEHLRVHLRVDTQKIDNTFIEILAQKAGKTSSETRELFQYIAQIQEQKSIDKPQLKALSKKIDAFI